MEIEHKAGDSYVITGYYANSTKRFKTIKTNNVRQALGINLWRGNVYQVRDGKRTLIKSVVN